MKSLIRTAPIMFLCNEKMVLEIIGNAPGLPEHDGKTLIMEIKYTNAEKKLIYKNVGISKKKKAHNT
jgi:hypothetical protein